MNKVAELIALKHTLFGLPVTLLGVFLSGAPLSFYQLFWIIAAFTAARTAGMALNRLFDEVIDGKNPRTTTRALPSGLISAHEVKRVAVISLLFFVISCAALNLGIVLLSPLIIALLFFYSLSKRATPGCHFILGVIEFFAPVFGWWAVAGHLSLAPLLLGAAVFCWISGMDLIYALQDIGFDRQWGVYSFPSLYGHKKALQLARILHFVALLCFIAGGFLAGALWPYWFALLPVGYALLFQPEAPAAFFRYNATISLFLFTGAFGSWILSL